MPRTKNHLKLLDLPPEKNEQELFSPQAAENCKIAIQAVQSTLEELTSSGGVDWQVSRRNIRWRHSPDVMLDTEEGPVKARLSILNSLASVDQPKEPFVLIEFDKPARINDLPVIALRFNPNTPDTVDVGYQTEFSLTRPTSQFGAIKREPIHQAEKDFKMGDTTYLFAACALVSGVEALNANA